MGWAAAGVRRRGSRGVVEGPELRAGCGEQLVVEGGEWWWGEGWGDGAGAEGWGEDRCEGQGQECEQGRSGGRVGVGQ